MAKITLRERDSLFPFSIEGLHYVTGKPVSLYILGGVIAEIKEIASLASDSANVIVAPGLIDNQINGYASVDFSGRELSVEGIIAAAEAILNDGVTSFLPTLITNGHEDLLHNFDLLNEACNRNEKVNACVAGFHLEGPYISPEDGFRGCHPVQHIRKPSWKEFDEYRKASGGRIIQVTVAPEVKGAHEFIKRCTDEGIIVALGHTNASSEEISLAVEYGARLSTHLGNGCANFIHRHKNPIWPQLADNRLTPTIIADGNHLLPEELRVFLKVKGTDNIILTSDVIYLAGMAPGNYEFSGMKVVLKENGMLMTDQDCLAGASFPLKKGVENIMKFTGVSISEAIKMASENPARIYKLTDRGTLEAGKRADIILLEQDGANLRIRSTYKGGILNTRLK